MIVTPSAEEKSDCSPPLAAEPSRQQREHNSAFSSAMGEQR